jgi:hypothetical protein
MSGIQLLFIGGGGSGRQVINLSIAAPAYNYDVYTNRGPTYVAGNSDITVTISPGVTVGSTSTGSYAFLVPSSFSPTDTVTVINQGVIQGRGGDGGAGGTIPPGPSQSFPGSSGGAAVYVNRPTTITNNGTLAGGGGGGGGGGAIQPNAFFGDPGANTFKFSGGGGGGGAGFDGGTGGIGRANPGISPPGPSQPGSSGTSASGGAGGGAGGQPVIPLLGGNGGAGGGRGASGSAGQGGNLGQGGAGTFPGGSGGGAGAYIVGQPFVTYPATGTRQGPSS